MELQEHDVVLAVEDIMSIDIINVPIGTSGTIIHVYPKNNRSFDVFEVEFNTDEGIRTCTVNEHQIMRLEE